MPRRRPPGQIDRILDAAEETFSRVGLERATMASIAQAAGLAAPTLYHYFESKDALFRWTLRRASRPYETIPKDAPLPALDPSEVEQLQEWLWSGAYAPCDPTRVLEQAPVTSPVEELRALLFSFYDRTWETRRVVNLLEASIVTTPQQWDAWFAQYASGIVENWAAYFRARRSLLPPGEDAGEAAIYVLSCCVYFARRRLRRIESNQDDESYRAAVVDLLVNSLGGKASRSG